MKIRDFQDTRNLRFLRVLEIFNFKEIFGTLKNAKAFLVCKKSKAFLSTLQFLRKIEMKFKRKKVVKQRGSKTHGYGAMKKHRGAGSRGGRGMAGTGKRGDAKKPSIQKNKKYFGKYGFKSLKNKKSKQLKKINIEMLVEQLPKLLKKKKAEKRGNIIFIDLKKLGYNKLLGTGHVKSKLEINIDYASKKAVEKIQKVGGKVNILVVKKEKPKKLSTKEENGLEKSETSQKAEEPKKEDVEDREESEKETGEVAEKKAEEKEDVKEEKVVEKITEKEVKE